MSILLRRHNLIASTSSSHDYSKDYLTFTVIENSTFSFSVNNLQYSLDDGTTWITLTAGNSTPQLSTGDKILWKQTGLTPNNSGIGKFSATGNFDVSGNIMSLYYGDNFIGQTDLTGKRSAFARLFYDCNKLVNAENFILPATTLATYCYQNMFYGCTSLTTAPTILPATTLTLSCYQSMFEGCTSLVTAPELLATTLAENCCQSMFLGCTSLVTAPELLATRLTKYCYSGMFHGCTSLNYIKCLATNISARGCTSSWVRNVSATGTFIKAANTTWQAGTSGIPSGWTVVDEQGS